MNKSVYLVLSILDLSKTVIYEFWYDYVKLKYRENVKLYYIDTESFIVQVKTDDIYKYITKNVETKLGTSNLELDRPLHKGKNKNLIGLMKDELGGKIMKEFIGLRAETYSYLKDNNDQDKKNKSHNKCVIKRKLIFQHHKDCLEATQIENNANHLKKKFTQIVARKIKKNS